MTSREAEVRHHDIRQSRRRSPRVAHWELLLDLAVLVAVIAESWRLASEGISVGPVALLAVAAGSVAVRRRLPLVGAAGALLAAGVALSLPTGAFVVWIMAQVVLLQVAMNARRRVALTIAVALGAVLYLGSVLVLGLAPLDPSALILLTWTAAVVGAGLTIRAHRDRLHAVAETAAAVLAARDSDIERHVADERVRIARDLHDSLAHSLAVISMHAGAAAQALPVRAADAADAVTQVQLASRTALAEMQQIVLLLRSDETEDDDSLIVATPSGLAETARALGDDVVADLPASSDLATLEPIVASALARVVQEGLTNARKHGTGPVDLRVRLAPERISVAIDNALRHPAASASPTSGGFGLVGMRERVSAIGGSVTAHRIAGRFEVRAELPRRLADGRSR